MSGGTGGGTGQCRPDASLAPARVWRITDEQYVNAVRQVFGVIMPPEITQASVDSADFTNFSELTIANANTVAAYETAARLAAQQAVTSHLDSFLPCGTTPPDASLWQHAEDGSIATPNGLAAEVDRLLSLPDVQANLSAKAGYWLGVEKLRRTEKDLSVFPEFTTDLKNSLYLSAQMFVQDIMAHGKVSDLLSSKRVYVDSAMARVYGIQGVTGNQLVPVEVQATERSSGIL